MIRVLPCRLGLGACVRRRSIAIVWLGAAALAWSAALAIEIAIDLRAQAIAGGDAAIYIGSLAIAAAAIWSAAVAIFQLALRIALRHGVRGRVGLLIALTAIATARRPAFGPCWSRATSISRQAYAGAVRIALLAILVAGWLGLWLWHAWGMSPSCGRAGAARSPRAGWRRSSRVLGVRRRRVGDLFVLLDGLSRPYLPLAEVLLFPSWLVAATLAFRGVRVGDRAGARGAAAMAVGASWPRSPRAGRSSRCARPTRCAAP